MASEQAGEARVVTGRHPQGKITRQSSFCYDEGPMNVTLGSELEKLVEE